MLAAKNAEADEIIKRLLGEHREMDAAWQGLRICLQGITEGHTSVLEKSMVGNFSAAYERHIELENAQLLPLSARLLSSAQLRDLGSKMAARRGVALARS